MGSAVRTLAAALWTCHGVFCAVQPIFFPCYLVTYQHQGQQLVGAVSGVDGQVSAQRLYSPLKAGAASAALLWSLGLLVATHSAVWVLASGLLAAAVAYTVRYIPLIGAALQQVAHARDVAQLQLQDHMGAAEELRRGERRARHDRQRRGQEHQQRRWQQEEEQAEQQGWSDYEVGANPFGFWRSDSWSHRQAPAGLVSLHDLVLPVLIRLLCSFLMLGPVLTLC